MKVSFMVLRVSHFSMLTALILPETFPFVVTEKRTRRFSQHSTFNWLKSFAWNTYKIRSLLSLSSRQSLRRNNFTCQYCGKSTKNLTIDHIIPRSKGGKHKWDNVVSACISCNHQKAEKSSKQLLRALEKMIRCSEETDSVTKTVNKVMNKCIGIRDMSKNEISNRELVKICY